MEEIITEINNPSNNNEENTNDIIQGLNNYLNSKFETEREDYNEITTTSIQPQLDSNGKWTIPGLTKTFNTQQEAYKVIKRYTDYITQNEASQLLHGVSYEEYIYGEKNGIPNGRKLINEIQSASEEGEDGPGNQTRNPIPNIKPSEEPTTPADFN